MDIDLEVFCAPPGESFRYALEKPFTIGGFRYATDGRIALRLPAEGEPDSVPDGSKKYPGNISAMFEGIDMKGESMPLTEVEKRWDGMDKWWRLPEVCDECKGSGDCYCKCGECRHDCGECDGKGVFPAVPEDLYKGKVIGGREFAKHYLYRLGELTKVALWPEATCRSYEPGDVLIFTFDGGMGLLMRLRDDE